MTSLGVTQEQLNDRNWKGEGATFPPEIAKRPSDKNRKCTDVLFCIFFLVFLGGMATCTIYGYVMGDPWKLAAPIAPSSSTASGNAVCGYDGNEGYDYLFFNNIVEATDPNNNDDIFMFAVCVAECPASADATISCSP
jgi:hypothetical protein